jgi:hypothetical protein
MLRMLLILIAALIHTGCTRFDPGNPFYESGGPDGGYGGPDAPPPACEGHTCPSNSPTMMLPEGGDFRYELFHVGYDEYGNKIEVLGGWSFFFRGQTPSARPILGPLVTEGIGFPDGAADCFNQTAANYYWSGWSAQGQTIVDTRTYYDLGESLTLISENGVEISMPKREPGTADPSTLLQHGVLYMADLGPAQAADLDRGVKYPLPQIAPVNDFPGLDLRGGVNVPANADWTDPPAMYMPHDFTLLSPTEEEYFNPWEEGGLWIDRTQDLTFAWYQPATPAGFPAQVQFTGFLTDDQTFQYLCITASADTQVIPYGLFSQPDFPASGKLIHGTLTHVAWAQRDGEEELRFDVIGVNCKFSTYTLVDAAQ